MMLARHWYWHTPPVHHGSVKRRHREGVGNAPQVNVASCCRLERRRDVLQRGTAQQTELPQSCAATNARRQVRKADAAKQVEQLETVAAAEGLSEAQQPLAASEAENPGLAAAAKTLWQDLEIAHDRVVEVL